MSIPSSLFKSPKTGAGLAASSQSEGPPPVILFGGNDNALSLVRTFGRRGIPVYVLNKPGSDVFRSRYAKPITLPTGTAFEAAAVDFLLSAAADFLRQSVLLAASDEALECLSQHHGELSQRYQLDLSNPDAQRRMLDKLATYEVAEQANVPTPNFWRVSDEESIHEIRQELTFPLIVKPIHSHRFQQRFRSKFLVAEHYAELADAMRIVEDARIEVFLVEKIPGPDSNLCSYYTYLDEAGRPLLNFTKRIIRRYPVNMGLATYHVTDHVPEVKELSLRLFAAADLKGLANAEFKYDSRDGQLKLIECNARFTAANALVEKAGIDLGGLVYNRLTGGPLPALENFRDGLTLWDPLRDIQAFRELRRRGEISFGQWLRSISRRQLFPSFRWSDPLPALTRLARRFRFSSPDGGK